MEVIIKAVIFYFFILAMLRIAGKRTVAEITTFDMVVILLIAETTQSALFEEWEDFLRALAVIVTLIVLEILMSFLKKKYRTIDEIIEGKEVVIVKDVKLLSKEAEREKIDE
jgi:uncharacterized membrane protein YcaP (DUF421 family)